MVRGFYGILRMALVIPLVAACTSGKPIIDEEAFNALSPSGKPEFSYSFDSSNVNSPFVMYGECDSRVTNLEVSQDGGVTWTLLSVISPSSDTNCSDGTFTIDMSSPVAALGFNPADLSQSSTQPSTLCCPQ